MHFFNPAPLMPLVEVVSGLATSETIAATVYATAAAWGKTPVRATSTPGFIVNRCARPFYAEALRLLAEGAADPATLDAVLREAGGFRMGPFELMDLIGLDVNFAVTKSVWEACFHDPRYAPSVQQQELVAAGFLGRKSGRGFYGYGPGATKPEPRSESASPTPAKITVRRSRRGPLAERTPPPESSSTRARRFAFRRRRDPCCRQCWRCLARADHGRGHRVRRRDRRARPVIVGLAFDYAAAPLAVARADTRRHRVRGRDRRARRCRSPFRPTTSRALW
jgi:3-hydroxybutyryl-CoA dehydrogenase